MQQSIYNSFIIHSQYIGNYYLTALILSPLPTASTTTLSLHYICPSNTCSSCKPGFDPLDDCTSCLPNYYGTTCQPCGDCHHGRCDDGMTGTGGCICEEGFTMYSNCTECTSGYWGETCSVCDTCNNHGVCRDGTAGDGGCDCDEGFDGEIRCSDCVNGNWGSNCRHRCPGLVDICSGHGVCEDGLEGTGRCSCQEGYVGISRR